MEHHRDKAMEALSDADEKIKKKDYFTAMELVWKAKALYPELDGLTQMHKTVQVLLSGEIKVEGEVEWYGVLDVSPSDDEETVLMKYCDLSLMLHPSNNDSSGAADALELLYHAMDVLCDETKRSEYNQRWKDKRLKNGAPTNGIAAIGVDRKSLSSVAQNVSQQKNEEPKRSCEDEYNERSEGKGLQQKVPIYSIAEIGVDRQNIIQQEEEKMKRKREELENESGREKPLKETKRLDDDFYRSGAETAFQVPKGYAGAGGLETDWTAKTRIIETDKKQSEWNPEAAAAEMAKKDQAEGKVKEETGIGNGRSELKGKELSSGLKDVDKAKKPLDSTSADDVDKEIGKPVSMNVVYPDIS